MNQDENNMVFSHVASRVSNNEMVSYLPKDASVKEIIWKNI